MKVGDEVEWYCAGEKDTGVVIEVSVHSYRVRWSDGSTSTEEYDYEYSGVRLKEDQESYIQAIQKKYPEDSFDEDYDYYEDEDVVNKPKHYMLFPEYGIEVRDLMILLANQLDGMGYSGILVSDYIQAMQYLLRWHNKNGLEDLKKSLFYLNKIVEQLEGKL